jgi:Na+-driven multidrug efflux pump
LIYGWAFLPPLGVAGAGTALLIFSTGAAIALALYMRSAASPVRLRAVPLEPRFYKDILRVGLLSAIGTLVVNLTVMLSTALVGVFGREAIAGYGVASRLDYLLIPLLFALGTASVTMVGTNVGAGQRDRARSITWTAALVSALATGIIGAAAALLPHHWMQIFSSEPSVISYGVAYLVRVAPFYAFIGLGMALYFASQGAGNVVMPFTVGLARLATVLIGGGYWVTVAHGSLNGLFLIIGASQFLFGSMNALAMATRRI